ncbi:hypothetical protein Droror1_Dr00006780 [Drosera rotundifolia]
MGRAPCCDKANVKKGPWAPEEDAKLKAYIEEYGTGGNWIALPQKIGLKRCGKSCRLRWLNYLRPNIKHGGFTEEEDNIICSLYISIGSRWSIIAAQLPGRTDNDIKNYWNTKLKKKLLGRRKQQSICSRYPLDSDETKHDVGAGASYTPTLSSSALERLQLHMQLQTLQSQSLPLLNNNPALWPKLHPLQEKMIQNLHSMDTKDAMMANYLLPSGTQQDGQDSSSMVSKSDRSVEESVRVYGTEVRFIQPVMDELADNGTRGIDQQGVDQNIMNWWNNELSSCSWDVAGSVNVQADHSLFQDYPLAYGL